jgi:hypothetical protein
VFSVDAQNSPPGVLRICRVILLLVDSARTASGAAAAAAFVRRSLTYSSVVENCYVIRLIDANREFALFVFVFLSAEC